MDKGSTRALLWHSSVSEIMCQTYRRVGTKAELSTRACMYKPFHQFQKLQNVSAMLNRQDEKEVIPMRRSISVRLVDETKVDEVASIQL